MGIVTRSKAGQSAWREYHRRLLPTIVFGIFLIVVCFSFVVLALNGQLGIFAMLLFFACLVSIYVFWSRNLEAISERWGAGAQAEVEVARELERLHKEGFFIFHDWDSGRGNVDHFVIGTQGVFVVETKALTGEITCENGKLFQNGRSIPKDLTRQAKGEAKTVSELIRSSAGVGAWVVPVLCFSSATLSCYGSLNDVEITNLGSLNKFIMTRDERYSPKEVKAIAHLLERKLEFGPAAGPDLPLESPNRVLAFLVRDRNLVAGILLLLIILTVIFSETTSRFLADLSALYKAIPSVF
jgi:Ca2+/Na+ antiporter